MKPESAEKVATRHRTQKETDAETERRPDQTRIPMLKDDGSVPDKQIGRWKDDGGAWQPAD